MQLFHNLEIHFTQSISCDLCALVTRADLVPLRMDLPSTAPPYGDLAALPKIWRKKAKPDAVSTKRERLSGGT